MKFYHILSVCLLLQLGACQQFTQKQNPAPVESIKTGVVKASDSHKEISKSKSYYHEVASNRSVLEDNLQINRSNSNDESNTFQDNGLPIRKVDPAVVFKSRKTAYDMAYCIQNRLHKQFNLPKNWFIVESYSDGAKTVQMESPFSGAKGVSYDVVPTDQGSEVRFYPNTKIVSIALRDLPKKCK